MKKLLITTCLVILIIAAKGQTYNLAFNFEKGKKYYVETTVDQLIKMDKLGEMNQKMVFGYTLIIDDINTQGNYMSTLRYERASMTNDMGASEALEKASSALIGLSYKVVFNKMGDVVSVSGLDSFVANYAKNLMGEIPGVDEDDALYKDRLDMVKTKLSENFNDTTISKEFGNTLGVGFHNGEVKIGSSWTKSYSNSAIKGAVAEIIYKLKSVDGDNATLTTTIKQKTKGNSKTLNDSMSTDLNIKGSGTIIVNIKTGLIVSSSTDLDANGSVTNADKKSNITVLSKLITKHSEIKD